jgi:hypothetical protein
MNKSKNKINQPPTGQSKEQSTIRGKAVELDKRSEVLQAQHHHSELNIGSSDEENMRGFELDADEIQNPGHRKAGR